MARNRTTVEVIPSARRLIRSLRDIGYDFKHAVADIIDNSVAAGASNVSIDMRFEGEDSWLRVADDGTGMSGTTITEAMRFGTEREYEADELGKFGLGLKTASLSQCSRFTVASRIDQNARRIETRQWDLGHVESTNRWEIIDIPASERPEILTEQLQSTTGTVVLWEQLDRVLGYKIPWGDRARNGFFRLAEELDLHLGMVFHRFLTGEAKRRRELKIAINGTNVEPWDPFARSENSTLVLPEQQFEITSDDGPGLVAYRPYILPTREQFSSLKAFERHAGPGKWNYQQGFYIYRADRMIQSGGWSYMRTSDEHTKLARVALEFQPDLDSAFDLNVSKARVNLPADLRHKLKPHVEQLAKQARKAYTPPSRPNIAPQGNHGHRAGMDAKCNDQSSEQPDNVPGDCSLYDNTDSKTQTGVVHGLTTDFEEALAPECSNGSVGKAIEQAAEKVNEVEALKRIRTALREQNPIAAAELGW